MTARASHVLARVVWSACWFALPFVAFNRTL